LPPFFQILHSFLPYYSSLILIPSSLQTKAQLTPAVKALGEVSALAEGMKPQLEGLKALVRSGGLLAQNAEGEANKANKEADAATRVSVC
jgi:hypothetical protein